MLVVLLARFVVRPFLPESAPAWVLLVVPVFWVAVGVFVIVQGGILYIALRFRHRKGRDVMPKGASTPSTVGALAPPPKRMSWSTLSHRRAPGTFGSF